MCIEEKETEGDLVEATAMKNKLSDKNKQQQTKQKQK